MLKALPLSAPQQSQPFCHKSIMDKCLDPRGKTLKAWDVCRISNKQANLAFVLHADCRVSKEESAGGQSNSPAQKHRKEEEE